MHLELLLGRIVATADELFDDVPFAIVRNVGQQFFRHIVLVVCVSTQTTGVNLTHVTCD